MLLLTFGSLLAAGIPLLAAVIVLGVSLEGVHLVTAFVPLNSLSTVLATLLGLAVGIDYSLFIVSRHRRQLRDGMEVRESIARAAGTAGSAVLFAAVTVIIALAGLALVNISFLTAMGLCGAGAVFVALLASLTLTPALLRLLGRRALSRRAWRQVTDGRPMRSGRIADRWARVTSRHPVAVATAGVVALLVIALPMLSMQLALPNDGDYPASTSARGAYDLKADGFGAGINAPIALLAQYDQDVTAAEVEDAAHRLSAVPGVAAVITSGVHEREALLTVLPSSGPSDTATRDLVHRLRDSTIPESFAGSPTVQITGVAAIDIDISERVSAAFPWYLAVIVAFAFVLLVIVFRSLLVPLKAVLGFVLSLCATLGGTVAIFQWGWGSDILNAPAGPLLSFLPVIVTGVLFVGSPWTTRCSSSPGSTSSMSGAPPRPRPSAPDSPTAPESSSRPRSS